MFELAAPGDVDAFGQRDFVGDDALSFIDEADDVAAAHVQRDVTQQPAVFTFDHRRTYGDAYGGHGSERNQPPRPRMSGHAFVSFRDRTTGRPRRQTAVAAPGR